MSQERPALRTDELQARLGAVLSEGPTRCQVVVQPGGHLWLVFEREGGERTRRAVVIWAARAGDERPDTPRLHGLPVLPGNGVSAAELQLLLGYCRQRLQPHWTELRPQVDMRNREVSEVPRTAAGLAKVLRGCQDEGQPCWHEWRADPVEEAVDLPFDGFLLPYRNGAHGVVFALVTAGEATGGPVVARTPLGEVLRLRDTRDAAVRARPEQQIERHLWWALGRSLHGGMRFVETPQSRLRLHTLLGGTRVPHDLGDDLFLGVWGEQAMSNVPLLGSTGIGGVVNHSNRECTVGMVHVTGLEDRLNFSPWKLPPSHLENFLLTDFDDNAALRGGEGRLEEAVTQAARASGKLPVFVTQMCEYGYLADDMLAVVERVVDSTDAAIALMHNPRPKHHPLSSFNNWWESVLEGSLQHRAGVDPSGVNLLGLGPPGPARSELDALLGDAGVHVHAHLFPQLDGRDLERLHRARLYVTTPWAPMGETVGSSLVDAGVPTLSVAAPYGFDGTVRWLDALREGLGLPPLPDEGHHALVAARVPQLAALRAEAAAHCVGFVVPEPCLEEAASAELFYGLRPFAFFEDLGFQVALLLTRVRPTAPPPEADAVAGLLGLREPARLHVVHRLPREPIAAALRRLPGTLLYSDYPADGRAAAAGKVPFSVRHFELGLQGAARTTRRLLQLAGVPFFDRYRAFLGEAQT